MRFLAILVVTMLGGCAPPQRGMLVVPTHPQMSQQAIEANRASEDTRRADLERIFETNRINADQIFERDRQAAIICHERGNMAAAQPAYGGRGIAGSINAGLQQGWAGSEVEAACLRAYSATGVLPSY